MELTVDQMLQQAIAAHNQNNLQEAERLYRVILQVQPKHPDANHNLGMIAVAMNQFELALPMFKAAIDVNPNIEQFWLNYIDALITARHFEDAKRALKKGKKKGVAKENIKVLMQKLISVKASNTPAQDPSDTVKQKLLNLYQNGQYDEAEKLALSITEHFPGCVFGWTILGAVLKESGRRSESLSANQMAVQLAPKDAIAHYNLANVLQELGRLDAAEASYIKAIEVKPDLAEAHNNLGNTRKKLGRLEEAQVSFRQAIVLMPDFAAAYSNWGAALQEQGRFEEAKVSYGKAIDCNPDSAEDHNNLGTALNALGRFEEAVGSYSQAIALQPGFAEAHSNLGNTLKDLGRFEEAEVSYSQAIEYNLGHAEAHNKLGSVLKELGRLEEAEASCRQAISLRSGYAEAHSNLGIILYSNGDIDSALDSMEIACSIDPMSKSINLLLNVLKAKKSRNEQKGVFDNINTPGGVVGLASNPVVLNRVVEPELITTLYEMNFRELNKTKSNDARYGNGRCSPDFDLFGDSRALIKTVADDLTRIIMDAVKSEIYIHDSFFNILSAGGGLTPHRHLNSLDKEIPLSLCNQKYSLVYYLSVGDQKCSEPGILKLYDPSDEILPFEGMLVIFPADRLHSAVYGGKKDRVMIGINFYSL